MSDKIVFFLLVHSIAFFVQKNDDFVLRCNFFIHYTAFFKNHDVYLRSDNKKRVFPIWCFSAVEGLEHYRGIKWSS